MRFLRKWWWALAAVALYFVWTRRRVKNPADGSPSVAGLSPGFWGA